MKQLFLSIFCFFLIYCAQAQPFEGIIKAKYNRPTQNDAGELLWKIKGSKIAMEINSSSMDKNYHITYFIDLANPSTFTLFDGKKAMSVPTNGIKGEDFLGMTVKEVDGNKSLQGYTCKHYQAQSNKGVANIWFAENIAFDYAALAKILKYPGAEISNLGMPLEIIATNNAGAPFFSLICTNVDAKTLSESEVVLPSNVVIQQMTPSKSK